MYVLIGIIWPKQIKIHRIISITFTEYIEEGKIGERKHY